MLAVAYPSNVETRTFNLSIIDPEADVTIFAYPAAVNRGAGQLWHVFRSDLHIRAGFDWARYLLHTKNRRDLHTLYAAKFYQWDSFYDSVRDWEADHGSAGTSASFCYTVQTMMWQFDSPDKAIWQAWGL